MGGLNRRRRRVWVDGVEFSTEKEAALKAGVAASTVSNALKAGGRIVKGREISPRAPRKPRTAAAVIPPRPAGGLKPLLHWPPGEGPLYQWSKRWR